ncbi:hypothetical protein KP509_33G054300 [Ceratopteris richardii]|uniref:Uncharacterized protein n=1 Tax=Ceratopteris richardii TaxID=49495 RepID=A0A8T2QPU0_CERRI|nr:hypothetical protein KP509_33G054300 [Ceratopteris richardii]KAH7285988.1 hypothetical protein KP509_33G054300 [Ceratopteris richardii]KAH7285989.1 hypothetical protein KP509_33G054300 [Ceratopteris richardii]
MEEEKGDDEVLARSGESGVYGQVEQSDPWSTGEIKNLQTKWLQQELEEGVSSDKELEESTLIPSLSLGRRSFASLRGHSIDRNENVLERTISNISDADLSHEIKDNQDKYQRLIEYVDILAHLALFGIIGVLIRYGLEVLFDNALSVTHELTVVYRDLPANMVGSFFMGWAGIVFKERIRSLSEPLAIGLSTGLMGSITTYAGWNQKMVELLAKGNVAASISGFLLGMSAAAMSLIAGIDSAKGLQITFAKLFPRRNEPANEDPMQFQLSFHNAIASFVATVLLLTCACGAALFLLIGGRSSLGLRTLWFAALVAPPGVWLRWHLARFNGKGIFTKFHWLPVGTLLANLLGASLDAIIVFLEFVMTSDNATLVLGGLQLGFVGCLSTVSTFVAEIYTMHVGRKKSRAYAYTFLTIFLGLTSSIFLYCVPSWKLKYLKW